jgi:hypothetical protein
VACIHFAAIPSPPPIPLASGRRYETVTASLARKAKRSDKLATKAAQAAAAGDTGVGATTSSGAPARKATPAAAPRGGDRKAGKAGAGASAGAAKSASPAPAVGSKRKR